MMDGLAARAATPTMVMINATSLKARCRATSLRSKKGGQGTKRGRLIGKTKDSVVTKLHALTDADSRPIRPVMTASQVSDHTGAAAPMGSLPKAERLMADRGYDAYGFREASIDRGIKPCLPGRNSRGKPIRQDMGR